MTAAELLARLAQRPPLREIASWRRDDYLRARAEFDRALLLDAVEYQIATHDAATAYFYVDKPKSQVDLEDEARDAARALRTIVTELRSNP